jgi:hypothetical protein
MIPRWKLRREFRRLGRQIVGLPRTIADLPRRIAEPARRRDHDARLHEVTRLTEGTVAPGERLAVFLVFQPKGVPASALRTCDWLIARGYAPLVVSNAPLSSADREALGPRCWRIMERPNFGYDFGGYRDAVRHLNEAGLSPERLIIMNDSVWFPMRDDVLDRLEALSGDIVGLLQDEKVAHDRDGGAPTGRRHIESYFMLIRGNVWASEAFQRFWRDYRMTDHKPHTIKYGEIGFSKAMTEAGFSLDALTLRGRFLRALEDHDAAHLRLILRFSAYEDDDIERDGRSVFEAYEDSETWRQRALEHIRRAVNRKRFNATFPLANEEVFGTHFLKKSREPIFQNMRRCYLRLLDDGLAAAPCREIEDELRAAVGRDFL